MTVAAYFITHNEGIEADFLSDEVPADGEFGCVDLYEANVQIKMFDTPEQAVAWLEQLRAEYDDENADDDEPDGLYLVDDDGTETLVEADPADTDTWTRQLLEADPEDADVPDDPHSHTYKIVRFYQDADVDSEIVRRGLTYDEARKHCNDPTTRGDGPKGPWFDGFEQED